jgi:hypothetical protein
MLAAGLLMLRSVDAPSASAADETVAIVVAPDLITTLPVEAPVAMLTSPAFPVPVPDVIDTLPPRLVVLVPAPAVIDTDPPVVLTVLVTPPVRARSLPDNTVNEVAPECVIFAVALRAPS